MSWIARAVSRKSRVATTLNSCGSNRCSINWTRFCFASKATVRKWLVRPRMLTFIEGDEGRRLFGTTAASTFLGLHPPDLGADVLVERMQPEVPEVGIPGEP